MDEQFQCKLKLYRIAQGLTQEQLANKVRCKKRNNHAP